MVETEEKIYYHGTETRRAYEIMTEGFKVGEMVHGRLLGSGLYIAHRLYINGDEVVTISAAIDLPELQEISARAQLEYEEEE
jgi:hypothetical protein